MKISRVYMYNFRNFSRLNTAIHGPVTCVIGENNTGKSNYLWGLRLALDVNLSSIYRNLEVVDIHGGADLSSPLQVLISVEFVEYEDEAKQMAFLGGYECEIPHTARITYRFRPRPEVVQGMPTGQFKAGALTRENYHWELTGGGGKAPDQVKWNESYGTAIQFSNLQNFHVVCLPALRDVEADMARQKTSPLAKVFAHIDRPESENVEILNILKTANRKIEKKPSIKSASENINAAYAATAGEAHQVDISLGMADPTTGSIAKSLNLLLSNGNLEGFGVERNGLGINNIIYSSMVLDSFKRGAARPNVAGQLLMIEEPEAHLHPQLQRTLYASLASHGFQTFITTHSPYITSLSPLASYLILTQQEKGTTAAAPVDELGLENQEVADLERFLDATRSPLLFARKVILVEGPAEQFLIPALVKAALGLDLDRLGISVIPIFGKHFDIYCKLMSGFSMAKKTAVIGDGDGDEALESDEGAACVLDSVHPYESDFLKGYACSTTFERAALNHHTVDVFLQTAEEFHRRELVTSLKNYKAEPTSERLSTARAKLLSTAEAIGKARFAQVAAKHAHRATGLPGYIAMAMDWILK